MCKGDLSCQLLTTKSAWVEAACAVKARDGVVVKGGGGGRDSMVEALVVDTTTTVILLELNNKTINWLEKDKVKRMGTQQSTKHTCYC